MTTTQAPQYRKTSQGEWVVFGPVDLVHVGEVHVVKRDGTVKPERVQRVGKPFQVDGVKCVYGYVAARSASRAPRRATRSDGRYGCDECGEFVTPGTRCWETGMTH